MMQWIQKLAPAALALTLALGGAGVVSAQAPTEITDQRAREIALDHFPGGQILEYERDSDDSPPEIEIEIRAQDGRVHDMTLDARNGNVIRIEEDNDD